MKTSVIDVHDMLSVLSVPGVEAQIGAVPGVESVTVNAAAGSATVRYDETTRGQRYQVGRTPARVCVGARRGTCRGTGCRACRRASGCTGRR